MKTSSFFAYALTFIAFVTLTISSGQIARAADSTASSTQGLTIIAQSSQQTYAVGEPVKIDVFVRNTGTADASIGGSAFDLSSFRFVVLDPTSHPLPETAYARKLLAVPTKVKTNTLIKIGAGWQRHYPFELSKMFAFTQPGMYSIAVKRRAVIGSGGTPQVIMLASDPIAITITGAASTAETHTTPSTPSTPASPKSAPRWTIAFVRSGDIWMANGEGNEQRLVIHNGQAPSWSSDKTMLTFARKGNVWICDPNGQNQKQLTDSASLEAGVNPVFSPDGKWIAYRSWSERSGIMVREVSIDGRTDKELVQDGEDPSW